GRRIQTMGAGEEQAALAQRLADIHAGTATLYTGEHRLVTPSGASLWAEITLSSLRRADGELLRIIAVVQDISERKRSELERARLVRELQEGIRARDDFLSLAAHELNTPITPLR